MQKERSFQLDGVSRSFAMGSGWRLIHGESVQLVLNPLGRNRPEAEATIRCQMKKQKLQDIVEPKRKYESHGELQYAVAAKNASNRQTWEIHGYLDIPNAKIQS